MFRTILVPYDGSAFAEQALPLAAQLARRSGAGLRLACVVPPETTQAWPAGRPCDEEMALKLAQWRLRQWAPECPVATQLLHGPVAPTLAEYAATSKADLIVMTTHGRGPLSRFWLGSVADELIRRSPVPLLVHRPADGAAPETRDPFRLRRILVPLDGTAVAEAALSPAVALARLFGAELHLLRSVEPELVPVPEGMSDLPHITGQPVLELLTAQARADLDRVARRLRSEGLTVSSQVAVHDFFEAAAPAVLEAAKTADLIVLATHGRGRVARFFFGSVADNVVRAAPCPVLVVHHHPTGGLSCTPLLQKACGR
jgi:nucleotide-binding universal stress UspA family protein